MSPVADNPVIVPDRECEEKSDDFGAHSAARRPGRKTTGYTQEASAQPVSTSGVRRSASCAADGCRTRSGMDICEKQEAVR